MNFFRRRDVQHDTDQPSIDGIVPSKKGGTFLSLREKVWKLEIYPAAIISYVRRHPKGVITSLTLATLIVIGLVRMSVQATESYFYPSSCLGGWEHPERATGTQEVAQGESDASFSATNSAVLNKSVSDLYCGGFAGDVPEGSTAGTFTVHLSWLVAHDVIETPATIDQVIDGTTPIDTSSSSSDSTQTDDSQGGTQTDQQIESNTGATEGDQNTHQDSTGTPASNDTSGNESSGENSGSVGAFRSYIPIAHAQEVPAPQDISVESGNPAPVDGVTAIDITPPENLDDVHADDFLEVLYTLDGTDWKHLGYVSAQDWRAASFTISDPLMDWGSIGKLQIELKSLPTLSEPVVIYLDSVYLSVSHDDGEIVLNPPKVLTKDASLGVVSGKENFQSGEVPTFTVNDQQYNVEGLANLVEQDKLEVIEDPSGVLGKPVRDPVADVPAPDTILQPLKDVIEPVLPNKIIEPEGVEPSVVPQDTPTENAPAAPPVSMHPILHPTINPVLELADFFAKRVVAAVIPKPLYAYSGQIDAVVYDAHGDQTDIATEVVTVSNNGTPHREVRVVPSRDFRPGHYTLHVSLHTPQAVIVSDQNFTWGVLAINFDKTVYQPGDDAYVQMAVLNDVGHTLCMASVDLSITSPSGVVTHFTTTDGTVVREPQCGPDNVISVPDYYSHYTVPNEIGSYDVVLTAVTDNGTKTVTDSFSVQSSTPYTIVRSAPTRIYPWAIYPVTLHVTAAQNWTGDITEVVPASFIISQPQNSQHYDDTTMHIADQTITWHVSLVAGQETTLGYSFDAPNISPEFFLIGPATLSINGNANNTVFSENRSWQIASDAACNATASGTWSATASFTSCTGAASGGSGTGNRPGSADSLTINSGVVLTADTTVTISALTFAASTVAASLTVSNGVTFTVSGATSIPSPGAAVANTITTGGGTSGTFSTAGITITGSTTASRNSVLSIPAGSTFTSTAGITFSGTAAQAQMTNGGAATINLTGTFGTGGTVTINAGTNMHTTGTVTLSHATTFGILSVDSGTTTMGAVAITFAGTTTVASGATLTASSATGAKTFTGAVTVNSTGVFDLKTASNFATASTFGGNITANGTTFNSGTGAVTLTGTGARSISGSGAVSLGGTLTIPTNIQLTNSSSNTVTIGAVTLASPTASNSLTLATGSTTSITGALTFTANAAAGQAQTVTLQGTAAVSAASITMPATTSTGTAKITATGSGGSLTVSGTTAITGSATTSGGLSSIDFTGVNTNFTTNALTVTAGTIGAASVIIGSGTFTANGLVTLAAAASGTAAATLTTATGTLVLKAGLTQSGTVIANSTFTTTGAATITFTGKMTGAGTKTINSATTFNTTGTVTMSAAVTLPTLNVLAGTTTIGNVAITVSGATNVTGTLANSTGSAAKTFTGLVTVNSGGTVNFTTATVPAVNFAGGITTVSGATSVNFGTGATTFTANQSISGPVSVTLGAVTISSGVTLTNSNTGTVTMSSLTMPIATAANTLSLSTGSSTVVSGATTFTANTQANPQTIQLNGTANFQSATLTMNAPTSTGGSTITCNGGSGAVTFTGAATITGNSTSTGSATLAIDTCTLNANGLVTVNGGTNSTGAAIISASTGMLDFNAGMTFANTLAQARMTTTGAATIGLTGTFSGLGTLSLNSATSVISTGTTAINSAYTFPNLTVSTGTVTYGAGVNISNALAISSGATLRFTAAASTITGTTTIDGSLTCQAAVSCTGLKTFKGLVDVNSGGIFDISNGSVMPTTSFGGGITMDGTTFNTGTGATTFTSNQNLAGGEAITLGGTVGINTGVLVTNDNTNTVTMAALNMASATSGATGMSLTTGSTTTITGALTYAVNNSANNESIVMNGTANLNAGSVSLLTPTSTGSELITCNGGSGTFAVTGAVTYSGNATTTGASTIDMDTCTMTIGGLLSIGGGSQAAATLTSSTGTLTIGAGITFSGTIANARLTTTGAGTVNLTGTVTNSGTININSGTTVHTTGTTTFNGAYTIGGSVSVDSGTTTLGAVAFTISGTTTVNGGTLTVSSATGTKTFTGLVTVSSGSLDFSSFAAVTSFAGGITANGTTCNVGSGGTTFTATQDLTGGSAIVFGGAVTINNTFTLTNNNTSTVDFNSTINGSGSSANFATGANSTTRFASTVMSSGTLTPSTSTNIIEYDGGAQTIKTASTNPYYDLLISAAGTKSLAAAFTAAGTVTITAGTLDTVSGQNYAINADSISIGASGTLLGQNSIITLTGNWTNAGTFTAGTSTVVFNGGATVTIDGTTTFYKLTITHSGAKEVDFATTGTPIFHVTNLFTVAGHTGALIKLYSANTSTQWQFHPTGTASVDYADVQDGGCQAGSILITPTNSTNSGNNDSCWSFTQTISFSLSDNAVDFGTLASNAARYASGGIGSGGSATEVVAHTIDAATSAPSGYSIQVFGDSLHNLVHTISAIGGVNSGSTVGSEQFGIRVTASGGLGAASSPYSGSGYAYDATPIIPGEIGAAATGDGATTTYSVRYIGNISDTTPSGAYSTDLTYVITVNF